MGHGTDAKQRLRNAGIGSIFTIFAASAMVLMYGRHLMDFMHHQQAAHAAMGTRQLVDTLGSQDKHSSSSSSSSAFTLPASTIKYFPQAQRCSTAWMQQYADLHAGIQSGALPSRYLVSVAVEAGLADRLTGLMTQFWHAMVTQRAFSTVAYGDVPSFAAMCDAPFVDWTTRAAEVPDEAVEPLKFTYKGVRGYPGKDRYLPDTLDPSTYQMLYLVNGPPQNLTVYQRGNISSIMQPDPAFLMAATNRGRSFALASNPMHKEQFFKWGVPPTDAFMCGFFFLCSPKAPIQQYYSKFWDALLEPGILKIGIQIRLGDGVFKGQEREVPAEQAVKVGAQWFDCADRLEKAFAAPGQKVVWYLNSDSQQLRKAAKVVYGSKLITDDELVMTHPDCFQDKDSGNSSSSHACQQAAMDEALQHSLGAMLTFSLTDYHIITKASGFGRLGAWLSGRWGNIYQIGGGQVMCTPGAPVPPDQSAFHYSGV